MTQRQEELESDTGVVKDNSVSVVLLAGGKGKRMGVSSLSLSFISTLYFNSNLLALFISLIL